MASAVAEMVSIGIPGSTSGVFVRHLAALILPGLSLAFIWTGPHPWYLAPFFMGPMVALFVLDSGPWQERRQPHEDTPAWPFDALVYLLAALQGLVVFELCRMYQHQAIFSVDTVMVFLVVGGSSGFSIITAHELIHRKSGVAQRVGRLLLCTVLYEHFYTEHLRGHHVRVGRPEDPATANFGEGYEGFFKRTVPAQFRSAWKLEARRLGDENMRLFDTRMLGNRILHGFAVGWGMAFSVWAAFGFAAFFVFLLQAFAAVRLLEAVNYFEHWGLRRRKARVRPQDSWDTHAGFTYYGLVGLSRHADHHAWPSRPYEQLRVWDEAPILPAGYVGTVDMVMGRNDEFRHRATLELARCGLGPFEPDVEGTPEECARAEAALAAAQSFVAANGTASRRGASWLRVLVFLSVFLAFVTIGGAFEAGASPALDDRLLSNLGILAVFTALLSLRARIEARGQLLLSWGVFFALLGTLGWLSEYVLG
jgi:alkane 1-monooxygenase